MPVYAATVLLSACLLFLVQPLIAKIILPWFGGSSAVWSVALGFFQTCLLCGYGYAHWLATRAQPRSQWIIHATLLIAACALMPIVPSDAWRPTAGDEPSIQILLLLSATVGLPSLLLSSTSPLLQVWYMRSTGSKIPYWLFALSNGGSLLALLIFPLLLEPAFDAYTLAIGWSIAFAIFAAACIYVAWTSRAIAHKQEACVAGQARDSAPSALQMLLWVLFSGCASALLVATTAQLSTNVAPMPLLWVVPLSLYLLSFILTFSSRRFYHHTYYFPFVAAALGCMAWLYMQGDAHYGIQLVAPLYLVSLFLICMACHGELVLRGPTPRYLTRFYLLIALGGALGGIFVGLIAPTIFDTYLELPVLLILIAELMVSLQWFRKGSARMLWPVRLAMLAGVLVLAGAVLFAETRTREENLLVSRNFYGALRVRDYMDRGLIHRGLIHGSINHGYQLMDADYLHVAGSYYSANAGVGRVLRARRAQGSLRVGVIGLGAGVLTSYARAGDEWRLYEINPAVANIADKYFSFLRGARARDVAVEVLIGDARLTLERQDPQALDVLIVDAFSSDAIPTHLLTSEAIALYFTHLKPDGVLAIHISNRYLNLAPVCQRAAEHVGKSAWLAVDPQGPLSDASYWTIITSDETVLAHPSFDGADIEATRAEPEFKGWTDQYSSLFPILKFGG